MNTKDFVIVSTVIFALVAIMHLIRLVLGWSVVLGMTSVPFWASLLVLLISASLAIWGFSLVRRHLTG
jgi:hypothetical protein